MKKIITLLLAGTMILGSVSCGPHTAVQETGGSATEDATVGDETTVEKTTSVEPDIDDSVPIYSRRLDENGFFEGVTASEIVTLPEYNGVDMDKSVTAAAEKDVQAQINGILGDSVTYEEITDRAVVDGDMLNIDYVGSIDGVEFAGGTTNGAGTTVTIGVTNYIDDFLYQLIGHMPGETINVEVTFPENYGKEELNGKDAVFVTTINYICGDAIDAELTDELAAEYGFASKEDLIADIETWLVENQTSAFVNDILSSAVCENIPEEAIDYMIEMEMAMISDYVGDYGMTVEDYFTASGYESKEAYVEASMSYYESNASLYLAAQAIAELEGLTVTDEDIAESGITEEELAAYGEPYIKQYVLMSIVIPEFIISNANIVETAE